MWNLHAGTLGFATVLLAASLSAMAFVIAQANPVGKKAAQSWGWTMASAAATFCLWFFGQDDGQWVDFLFGNSMAVCFSVLFIRSTGLLVGRPIAREWLVAIVPIGLIGLVLTHWDPGLRWTAVLGIALTFMIASTGSIYLISKSERFRQTGWGKVMLVVLTIWTLAVGVARVYALTLDGGAESVRPLASSHVQIGALIAGIVFLVIVSLSFMAAVADQQRRAVIESARRDGLTGALTRVAFFESASERVRTGEPYAIAMVDVDHFKAINDTFGHQGGDTVLRHITRQLQRHTRTVDLVGRYGGEEFCILLADTTEAEALQIVQRICDESSKSPARLPDERSATCSVSIGLACSKTTSTTIQDESALEQLLNRADQALYEAKRNGRNQVRLASDIPAQEARVETPSMRMSHA